MSDEIRIPLAEAIGEIREAIRTTMEAEAVEFDRNYDGLSKEERERVLNRMARNVAMRLGGRNWGKP